MLQRQRKITAARCDPRCVCHRGFRKRVSKKASFHESLACPPVDMISEFVSRLGYKGVQPTCSTLTASTDHNIQTALRRAKGVFTHVSPESCRVKLVVHYPISRVRIDTSFHQGIACDVPFVENQMNLASFCSHPCQTKVVICAYLGIGLSARTIITPTEAWSSLAPISVRNGHPVPIWGNMAASPGIFTSKPSANLFESRFGNSGRTKQYAFEQQSRRIHSVGRGAEGRSAALSSSGNDRSSIRPLMSMAGEGGSGGGGGGGTDSARQNAVLGALTVAGFGAVYYA